MICWNCSKGLDYFFFSHHVNKPFCLIETNKAAVMSCVMSVCLSGVPVWEKCERNGVRVNTSHWAMCYSWAWPGLRGTAGAVFFISCSYLSRCFVNEFPFVRVKKKRPRWIIWPVPSLGEIMEKRRRPTVWYFCVWSAGVSVCFFSGWAFEDYGSYQEESIGMSFGLKPVCRLNLLKKPPSVHRPIPRIVLRCFFFRFLPYRYCVVF